MNHRFKKTLNNILYSNNNLKFMIYNNKQKQLIK